MYMYMGIGYDSDDCDSRPSEIVAVDLRRYRRVIREGLCAKSGYRKGAVAQKFSLSDCATAVLSLLFHNHIETLSIK